MQQIDPTVYQALSIQLLDLMSPKHKKNKTMQSAKSIEMLSLRDSIHSHGILLEAVAKIEATKQ